MLWHGPPAQRRRDVEHAAELRAQQEVGPALERGGGRAGPQAGRRRGQARTLLRLGSARSSAGRTASNPAALPQQRKGAGDEVGGEAAERKAQKDAPPSEPLRAVELNDGTGSAETSADEAGDDDDDESQRVASLDEEPGAGEQSLDGDVQHREVDRERERLRRPADARVAPEPRPRAAERAAALKVTAMACERVRSVMVAFSTEEVRGDYNHTDPIRRSLANAMPTRRAGDVQFVLKPYWLNGATPASHGSPHAYDREVVGLAYGASLPAGVKLAEPITPGFGAVLFAKLLSIPKPSAAHETVPAGFFDMRD